MKLLVVGTVAYDTIKTPFGQRERILGGSAAYCSAAASFFTEVGIMAVVGDDFLSEDRAKLENRKIDLQGLSTVSGGKSFHWRGEYGYDLNDARTLATDLNVLAQFDPEVPDNLRDVPYLFLANGDPKIQQRILDQVNGPKIVAADTMNYWISDHRKNLMDLLPRVHILIINEAEARQLTEEFNLVRAAHKILAWGPKMLIIKRGEYGVLKVTAVFDPTGAGDSFAGGFMGHLASVGDMTPESVHRAIVMGSVMASFNVEDFSLNRVLSLEKDDIEARFRAFRRLTEFSDL
jgi:sugar/nucleoside kinase (ribokinase family)